MTRDTTRALRLARDIRLSIPIDRLTKRVVRMFDQLEEILAAMGTERRKPMARKVRR